MGDPLVEERYVCVYLENMVTHSLCAREENGERSGGMVPSNKVGGDPKGDAET